MFMLTIACTLLIAAAALFAASLSRRAETRLQPIHRLAMIVASAAVACALAAGTASAWLLSSTAAVLLLTVAVSLATVLTTNARKRRMLMEYRCSEAAADPLWIAVSRAVADAPSLNEMLMDVACAIRHATESESAVVYKLARNGREVIPVGSAHAEFTLSSPNHDNGDLRALARRSMADGRVAEYRHGRNPRSQGPVWGLIPLGTERTVYGTILMEGPKIPLTEAPLSSALSAVGKLVGRAIEDWVGTAAGASATALLSASHTLLSELTAEKTLERGLPSIVRSLKGLVEADFISLAWLDRARYHEDRVSMVVNDQAIIEQRRRWPVWEGTTRKIMDRTRPLITPDLTMLPADEDGDSDTVERRLGFRSRIVIPVMVADTRDARNLRLAGSLTLAHRQAAFYGEDETRPLEMIATLIGTWLGHLEAQRTADEFVDSAKLAARLENDSTTWHSEEELLQTILPAVGSTGLRLYKITGDMHGVTLLASAGRWRNGSHDEDRDLWPVALSDLPWHRWALKDGKPLYVDQGDPESLMGDKELQAAMASNMKTGFIVPVISGDRTLGFLDAMEARDPDRQTILEPQRMILNAAAGTIARRWSVQTAQTSPQVHDEWRRQMNALNGTVVNPITGIIGSVELIRHKQTGLTGETIKYLNLIEHSATRIHEALLGTLDRIPEDNPDNAGSRSETIARRLFGALTLPANLDPQVTREGARRLITDFPRPGAMIHEQLTPGNGSRD